MTYFHRNYIFSPFLVFFLTPHRDSKSAQSMPTPIAQPLLGLINRLRAYVCTPTATWLGSEAPLTAFLAFDCCRMQGEIAGGFDSLVVLLLSWGRKGEAWLGLNLACFAVLLLSGFSVCV
jgi:hypothetical protein